MQDLEPQNLVILDQYVVQKWRSTDNDPMKLWNVWSGNEYVLFVWQLPLIFFRYNFAGFCQNAWATELLAQHLAFVHTYE